MIGTGNIVGVATAVSLGGAGAIFWMIVSAFFGMIIKCVEIALCVMYKGKRKGPFGYISKAFSENKFMLSVFGLATLFSSFTTGNITQTNTVAFAFSAPHEQIQQKAVEGDTKGESAASEHSSPLNAN